jgi:hypothetical protein
MGKRSVYRVDEVYVEHLKTSPINLHIHVIGVVDTSGWINPELLLRTVNPDNIKRVFDFIAQPPAGPSLQVITPIDCAINIPKRPDFHEIEISTFANNIEVSFEDLIDDITIVSVVGFLTDEGVECQALRTLTQNLFTLVGDMKGLHVGDLVMATGIKAKFSTCMQGTTIELRDIIPYILDDPAVARN